QRAIPLGARVLALANAYVGMTHSPHTPLTPERALTRLRKAAGSRFDPRLITALEGLLHASGDVHREQVGAVELVPR
ncbi:MAG TPA: HD domain-containing phosphohydrolase, partial [Armatimonadota bacterium]|nr:HD domain-containing phosphohydrolase [Armatimonadota bacterium]